MNLMIEADPDLKGKKPNFKNATCHWRRLAPGRYQTGGIRFANYYGPRESLSMGLGLRVHSFIVQRIKTGQWDVIRYNLGRETKHLIKGNLRDAQRYAIKWIINYLKTDKVSPP